MITSNSLVSVIIPAYNAEKYIRQAIESALSQTYANIEVLVVDDGSTDTTPEIVREFSVQDSRVILLQQPNAGVAAARNSAIKNSKGEFIAPLDADDIWHPKKLEKQVDCFAQSEKTVGLVYTWSFFLDENGQQMSYCQCAQVEGKVLVRLIFENSPGNSSCPLIRRSCLEALGSYDCHYKEQNAQGCEDWDLYLRIAENYEFRVVPECLVGYRQVVGSMSFNDAPMVKGYKIILKGLEQRHPNIPTKLYQWSIAHFYWYIALKCRGSKDHRKALHYLSKTVQLDSLYLLNASLYYVALHCFLKILSTPLGTLPFWLVHQYWKNFSKQVLPASRKPKLEPLQIYQFQSRRRFPRNYFTWLLKQRLNHFEEQYGNELIV
ncbi:MAG: glycosyltransferase family 2 protein [Cyanobacteria bacterium J069]|nr:MAG: glycosyltransferase family 2 protein [Cyanobacteria bacterium J069]